MRIFSRGRGRKPRLTHLVAVVACLAGQAVAGSGAAGASGTLTDALRRDAERAAADLGLPIEVVTEQLTFQDAVGDVERSAQERWRSEYAGLWIEPADGTVNVAFTAGAEAKVAELAASFPRPDRLRAVTAARSYDSLDALLRTMIADRELAHDGALSIAGVRGGSYTLEIDVPRNVVAVSTGTDDPAAQASFRERYGPAVVVTGGALPGPAYCNYTDCRYSLRSGLEIKSSSGAACSTAFATLSSGIMTAAHCGNTTNHAGQSMGYVAAAVQSGTSDAEVVNVTNNGFYPGAWIWVTSGEQTRPVTSTGTYNGLAVGASVCKAGRTTGYTCGTVTSKTFSFPPDGYVPSGYNFIKSSMCVQGGDSGGGVFSGNQAVGIVSGAASQNGVHLACNHTSYYSVFGHIEYAQSNLGRYVKTGGEWGPYFSYTENAVTGGTTVQVRFDKPVRCSSASASDFTVRTQSLVDHPATGLSCGGESNRSLTLTVSVPFVGGTSVGATQVGTVLDVYGNSSSTGITRYMTVPV